MQRELEYKVELRAADVAALEQAAMPDGLSAGPMKSEKLRSVYFDTPEHDLRAAGISLRVRHHANGCVQTVKANQTVDGISNPIEAEAPVASEDPDLKKIPNKKLRRMVEKACKGTTLHPVFETVVRRSTRKITTNDAEVELAVDQGEVCAGTSKMELSEAEFELKAGSAEGLLSAAERLLDGHAFQASRRSKAERGYQLALGKQGTHTEPEKARAPLIRRSETSRSALAAVLQSTTRQVLVNRRAVLETADPQAAHQLRIGLRRLRSALRALRPVADGHSLRSFERCARDFGRCVGQLRDADVLLSDLIAPVEAGADDKEGFATLRAALEDHRESRREDVRAALQGPAWTKLQLYLTLWPRTLEEHRDLDRPITKHAREVAKKAWKKPAKLGRDIDTLNGARRHEMRKALKKLRYSCELFAPVLPRRKTKRFLTELKVLQDVFGYVNDARMATKVIEIQQEQQAGRPAAVAAGYVVGTHKAEARHVWKGAHAAWKKLNDLPRPWA